MNDSLPGAALAEAPQRDARFAVRDRWQDCVNLPEGDPRKVAEFLHRQMNEEVDALECSARSICDFPDAPWETRLFLARQCSDEARHAQLFRDLFVARGGTIGEYPVMNFQYRIICGIDSLLGRLAADSFLGGSFDETLALTRGCSQESPTNSSRSSGPPPLRRHARRTPYTAW